MTKAALRAIARDRLRALPAEERERRGMEAARSLWSLDEMRSARSILLYASLPEEVPTGLVAEEARRRGIAVVYPRCLPGGNVMTLHRVAGPTDLDEVGRFGILEPSAECPEVDIADIDVAVIPGLAWDRTGARLGRGAGYYDRLLATPGWRAFRCGLYFAVQELPHIPIDPWDVPLDAVVTESEIWRRMAGSGPQPQALPS